MSLARDITTVGSGTLMSRLLAYLRDAWIAALLGAGPQSEAFFAVLQVVNFFRRLLSEGALNSAFVPIWLKLRADEDGAANAARFTRRVLLTMFCIAGFLALLMIFFAPVAITVIAPGFDRGRRSLAAFLLFMVAPYIVLVGLVAVIASASPAAVSWLYYANRLYELPLGVASVALSAVIVPRIAAGLVADDGQGFANTQSRAYEIALGLALPAAAGFFLLANPIAGGLFERGAFSAQDTAAVAGALGAISAGLPGHVLEKVFGAVSFAHEDTQTPMLAALSGLAVAVIGGVMLFPRYGHIGVAAAFGSSGWIGAAVLGSIRFRRNWLRLDSDAKRRLPRIVFATAAMGAAVVSGLIVVLRLFPVAKTSSSGRLALLIALVTLGAAVYAATLRALGVIKLREIVAAMSTRT